jgi:multiple sugar transport system substrate-binding protein
MIAAINDVMANSVRKNGDPKAQLAAAEKKVNTELKKLFG